MSGTQGLPRLWLMTDERLGDRLLASIAALPRGAGIIFRHYATPAPERRALFEQVRRLARARQFRLLLAGTPQQARQWRADGSHGRHRGAVTTPVHSIPEIKAAERQGARLLFLSPVFPTQSHPGARTLGRLGFRALCRQTQLPVIALGGMTAARARALRGAGIYGWAAIDGLTARQP
jgi:thiamine-phosphate pyrophosphorylase